MFMISVLSLFVTTHGTVLIWTISFFLVTGSQRIYLVKLFCYIVFYDLKLHSFVNLSLMISHSVKWYLIVHVFGTRYVRL